MKTYNRPIGLNDSVTRAFQMRIWGHLQRLCTLHILAVDLTKNNNSKMSRMASLETWLGVYKLLELERCQPTLEKLLDVDNNRAFHIVQCTMQRHLLDLIEKLANYLRLLCGIQRKRLGDNNSQSVQCSRRTDSHCPCLSTSKSTIKTEALWYR